MNCRQKKKVRRRLYKQFIEDVALEISLDAYWRKRILGRPYYKKLEITYRNPTEIPKYILKDITLYKLEFEVMRINSCREYFDKELEIFKFQSKEFPAIIRYTGNNPNV